MFGRGHFSGAQAPVRLRPLQASTVLRPSMCLLFLLAARPAGAEETSVPNAGKLETASVQGIDTTDREFRIFRGLPDGTGSAKLMA